MTAWDAVVGLVAGTLYVAIFWALLRGGERRPFHEQGKWWRR